MEPIRILIADDDPGMRTVMRLLVERSEGYSLVSEAADGDELLKLYDQTQPQVILMDVEMPGLSGIECARIIQDRDPRTVLVFATAHEEYMRSAFEVYAFDYLVKPFRTERALGTLKLIRGRLAAQSAPAETPKPVSSNASGRMMLKHRDGLSFLNFADILLVQREDRASVIYTSGGGRFVTGDALSEIEARLPEEMFFRTHKSYIVNLNRIDSISPYGRWTYIVKLQETDRDALITHERFEELQKRFS